jgi:endoglucanase
MTRLGLVFALVVVQGCGSKTLVAVYQGELTGDDSGTASDAATADAQSDAPIVEAGSDAPVSDAAPSTGLHTNGSAIVGSTGKTVRLTGVTWHGMDTKSYQPEGLWMRPLADYVAQIKRMGYDSIRLPLAFGLLDPGSTAKGDPTYNPDLVGASGLRVLDRVVSEAENAGLGVILCQSFWEPPEPYVEDPLWHSPTHTEDEWIAKWQLLASQYASRPTVLGFELHNAPHDVDGSISVTWGDGGPNDWHAAATRAGNAIMQINPRLLIFVDGIHHVGADSYWWGGNLQAVRAKPVELTVPNRVVYATHEYGRALQPQPWFSADANYYDALPLAGGVWDKNWGYLVKEGLAPVWIAEFGTPSELGWLGALVNYVGPLGVSFAYRAFNSNTGVGGLLDSSDWKTVNQDLQSILAPALSTAP